MRIWVSESAGKKEFLAFLADTYAKKPILACETRGLMNACVRNFTIANDPNSSKFSQARRFVDAAVQQAIKLLPGQVVVFDDWYDDSDVPLIDYFVMHKPEDSDAIYRIVKPEGDIVKVQTRAVDNWSRLRSLCPTKLLVLGYDDRVRDLFDVIEDGDGGVELRLKTTAVSDFKYKGREGTDERTELARVIGGQPQTAQQPIFQRRNADSGSEEDTGGDA